MEKLNDRTGLTKRSFIVSLMECSPMIQTYLMKKFRNGKIFIIIADPHAALNGQTPYERFREKVGLCV
jgi:ribosomal protein L21E